MKRLLYMLAFSLLLASNSISETVTVQNVLDRFRARMNETDTLTSLITNDIGIKWLNDAQGKIVIIGGHLQKSVDFAYDDTLKLYTLPDDYRVLAGMMIWNSFSYTWEACIENPFFARDTTGHQFFAWQLNKDTTYLYVRSDQLRDDDTMRVFYQGGVSDVANTTDTVGFEDDQLPFVLDEMIVYYHEFLRNYQVHLAKQERNRSDQGIRRQVDKR